MLHTFERLWNLIMETNTPIWSPNKLFISKNLVKKSFQKIWFENSQKRRPRGSSIKHGEIWPAKFGQMCLPQILQGVPPPLVWIVNLIFSWVWKWNDPGIESFERVFNRNWTLKKNTGKNYFSNSWLSLISKSVSTDTSCRADLVDLLTATYFHFNWLATVYLLGRKHQNTSDWCLYPNKINMWMLNQTQW